MDQNRKLFEEALQFADPTVVPLWENVPLCELESVGAWEPMRQGGTDNFGVKWKPVNQPGVMCMPESHPISTLDDIDAYVLPNPGDFALTEESLAIAKEGKEDGKLLVAWSPMLLFERMWALLGMEEFMVGLITHRPSMERLIERVADYQIAVAERWISSGIDIYRGTDDLGGKSSLLISADMWREMFKPHVKRIFDVYKKAGVLVWLHCCGHIEELVPDFVELGVDILDPVQASANNLGRIRKATQGKILLWGGIDSHLLMTATKPEEIDQAVKEGIKTLHQKGGYVLAPDQSMPFPERNIKALRIAWRTYGRVTT